MPSSSSSSKSSSSGWWWRPSLLLSPKLAFILVSFCLGELGDGLNIFQGIYLVGIGWNESSVGAALSIMGLTSLLVQPFAGDWVDKAAGTTGDNKSRQGWLASILSSRRIFLVVASIATAISASTILKVRQGNYESDHMLIYTSKVIEGIASSFIGPCLAALTLASFGPDHFDKVMASNIFWGHVGSVAAAISAGIVAYISYPDIKYCFLVIGASALVAVSVVPSLPEGDPMMGRGFQGTATATVSERPGTMNDTVLNEESQLLVGKQSFNTDDTSTSVDTDDDNVDPQADNSISNNLPSTTTPEATSYLEIFLDTKTSILCMTGFFFHFANANVLLVLGELMGSSNDDQNDPTDDMTAAASSGSSLDHAAATAVASPTTTASRSAIPLTAGAIVTAQVMMAITTWIGNKCTERGVGRKPLFMSALLTLPIRCALIILFKDAGHTFLLSTQLFDGIGGGLFGLIHPYLVADITFGTGRFNVVMGLTASCFGLGATLSNYLGQMVVEHFGHIASLTGSLVLSIAPIILFSNMPETLGRRGDRIIEQKQRESVQRHDQGVSYQAV